MTRMLTSLLALALLAPAAVRAGRVKDLTHDRGRT
jgi:hypothetical protein